MWYGYAPCLFYGAVILGIRTVSAFAGLMGGAGVVRVVSFVNHVVSRPGGSGARCRPVACLPLGFGMATR